MGIGFNTEGYEKMKINEEERINELKNMRKHLIKAANDLVIGYLKYGKCYTINETSDFIKKLITIVATIENIDVEIRVLKEGRMKK